MSYRDFVKADPRVTRLDVAVRCQESRSRGGRCFGITTWHFDGPITDDTYFPGITHRSRDVCWSHLAWYLAYDYRRARTATSG